MRTPGEIPVLNYSPIELPSEFFKIRDTSYPIPMNTEGLSRDYFPFYISEAVTATEVNKLVRELFERYQEDIYELQDLIAQPERINLAAVAEDLAETYGDKYAESEYSQDLIEDAYHVAYCLELAQQRISVLLTK